MLPLLTSTQIKAADAYTIAHEPIASIDLMERASTTFCNWFKQKFTHHTTPVYIFCGTGNNGGDGLAISRILLQHGYTTKTYIVTISQKSTADFDINLNRLNALEAAEVFNIAAEEDFPLINGNAIIIDALFGTGLNKPVEGLFKKLIDYLNTIAATKVAVDIPSGLFCDTLSEGSIFKAHYTLSFQLPKYAFMFPQNFQYVGEFFIENIGLNQNYIQQQIATHYYVTFNHIATLFKKKNKFDHKGTYGHTLIIGGSYGKIGAAVLSARAALHTGCGLVTAYIPACGYNIMQTALPEAMTITDVEENYISAIKKLPAYHAVGIGIGLGKHKKTAKALLNFLTSATTPLVIDADSLNILAEHPNQLHLIPKGSVLTPHPKEFERLFGKSNNDFERHEKQITAAKQLGITIILKGAHTATVTPNGTTYFNSTGNAGMATAGSGDVLTGIITGLLAQGYTPEDAAIAGVYIHGRAGDIAANKKSKSYITATDITDGLSSVFLALEQNTV
jgi:NAD(P)H-hydrate epimerase